MSTSSKTRRTRGRARAGPVTTEVAQGHRGPGAANPVVAEEGSRAREVPREDLHTGTEPGGDADGASGDMGGSTLGWATVGRKGRASANVPSEQPAANHPNPFADGAQQQGQTLVQTRIAPAAETSVMKDPVQRLAAALTSERGTPPTEAPGGTPTPAFGARRAEQGAFGQANASGPLFGEPSRHGGTSNAGDALGQLPVNAKSSVDDDKFLNQGFAMLSTNSPGGVAQFFDRDYPAEMAKIGMEGFQEFMVRPDNLDKILKRLEKARGRIYK